MSNESELVMCLLYTDTVRRTLPPIDYALDAAVERAMHARPRRRPARKLTRTGGAT